MFDALSSAAYCHHNHTDTQRCQRNAWRASKQYMLVRDGQTDVEQDMKVHDLPGGGMAAGGLLPSLPLLV